MNLTPQVLDRDYFEKMRKRIAHNYQIADFYQERFEAEGEELYSNKSRYIDGCGKLWDIDHYEALKVKDVRRVSLCHDKFCLNCQSMLAAKRYGKFTPIIDGFKDRYKILHVIFTVPNCAPEELKPLLNRMYRKFPFLLRYFKGKKKGREYVHGVNFLQYGYGGAVRGLEITVNQLEKTFHPHFHCMMLLSPKIDLRGKHTNAYSFDHNDPSKKHVYSDFEILLQKVWYLLLNDCKVTAEAIEGLKIGYDVQASDPHGNYHEVFKYACKGAFDEGKEDEGAAIHKAHYFWTLYGALKKRRMIQGYGALHKINDLDGANIEEDAAAIYAAYVEYLQKIEKPVFKVESFDEVCDHSKSGYKIISKNSFLMSVAEERRRGGEND